MGFDFIAAVTGFATKVQAMAIGAGPLGIFLGMVLESSIVPFPSEAILVAAPLFGYTPLQVAIWGGLGSTVGGVIGYHIGKWGGRPLIKRFGKYVFITPDKLDVMEDWFKRMGSLVVLTGRLLPMVPYKLFSITAGIARMDIKNFVVFTLLGSIPRAFLMAWLGYKLVEMGNWPLAIASIVAIVTLTILVDEFILKYIKSKSAKK